MFKLYVLKSLREIVEYFQAMAFVAPWLSFTKVLFFRHVDNAPLHRINAVVWNGFNGCSVRQRMDYVVVSFAHFSPQRNGLHMCMFAAFASLSQTLNI